MSPDTKERGFLPSLVIGEKGAEAARSLVGRAWLYEPDAYAPDENGIAGDVPRQSLETRWEVGEHEASPFLQNRDIL